MRCGEAELGLVVASVLGVSLIVYVVLVLCGRLRDAKGSGAPGMVAVVSVGRPLATPLARAADGQAEMAVASASAASADAPSDGKAGMETV